MGGEDPVSQCCKRCFAASPNIVLIEELRDTRSELAVQLKWVIRFGRPPISRKADQVVLLPVSP